MPNINYVAQGLDGEQIEAALTAIDGVVSQENNGKLLAIEAGKIVAKSASEWTDTPVLEPLSVTANGDYTPGAGVDGFNAVHVDVSGGGGSKIVTVVTSVTGGYNGGAVITIVVDGVTIFTATAPDTYNKNYDKTIDTVDFSGDIIAINITPPPTSTSKLGIDISSSTDGLNFQVSPDGANTSYGYSFSDTSTLRIAQGSTIEPLSVTQNGTYNPPSGVDGYAPVTVDVQGGMDGIHFSVDAPTSADGENGDYWYRRVNVARAPLFTPTSNASAVTGGLVFTAVDGTTIVGLAFFARVDTVSVHLSTMDGTELAAFNDVSATPDVWNEYLLDDPVTLSSGVSYVVWGAHASGGMKYISTSTDTGGITYVGARYSSNRNTFPTNSESNTRYGVAVLTGGDYLITDQWKKSDGAWVKLA